MSKWISVDDRVPEVTMSSIWSDHDCIIATDCSFEIGRTKNGKWVNMLNQEICNATHWMPLPEPPNT